MSAGLLELLFVVTKNLNGICFWIPLLVKSNSFRQFLSYIGPSTLRYTLEVWWERRPRKESNRESSQVNRKWKENLRGKIKTEMSPSGKIEKMECRNQSYGLKLVCQFFFLFSPTFFNIIRWHLYLPHRQDDVSPFCIVCCNLTISKRVRFNIISRKVIYIFFIKYFSFNFTYWQRCSVFLHMKMCIQQRIGLRTLWSDSWFLRHNEICIVEDDGAGVLICINR